MQYQINNNHVIFQYKNEIKTLEIIYKQSIDRHCLETIQLSKNKTLTKNIESITTQLISVEKYIDDARTIKKRIRITNPKYRELIKLLSMN